MAKIKIPIADRSDDPLPKPERKTHFKGSDKPSVVDEYFPCQWRGVGFPISSLRISLQQDLVQHKYWGEEAANVEATGRAPLEIEAVIPFFQNVVGGKKDRFGRGLFPSQFILFEEAFSDRTTGVLDTPQIAGLTCKPVSMEYAYDPMRRDGVEVTARWVETVDLDLASDVRVPSANSGGEALLSLDAEKSNLETIARPDFDESFESLLNKLGGIADTTTSRFQILLNKPDQVLYRLKRLQDSVQRAKNALTWPIEESIEKAKEVFGPQTVVGTGPASQRQPRRPTARFTTSSRTTLTQLQSLFPNNSVDDLLFLNPRLAARPTVPAGTVLRHYL